MKVKHYRALKGREGLPLPLGTQALIFNLLPTDRVAEPQVPSVHS